MLARCAVSFAALSVSTLLSYARADHTIAVRPRGTVASPLVSGDGESALANATWEQTTSDALFGAREASGSLLRLGASLLLVGGSNGSTTPALAGVWSSGDGGRSWSLVSDGPSPPRVGSCALALPSGALVAGGLQRLRGARVKYLSDVWTSGPDGGGAWTQLAAAAAWSARAGHGCAVEPSNGLLLLFGGLAPSALADVWTSGDGGATWVAAPAPQWAPRAYMGVAVHGGRVWLAGGSDFSTVFGDVWFTGDGAQTWQAAPGGGGPGSWAPRSSPCLFSLGSSGGLWLLGGRAAPNASAAADPDAPPGAAAGLTSDIWRSDAAVAGWALVEASAPWGPRAGAGCAADAATLSVTLLGGTVEAAGDPPVYYLADDVWLSTPNLACEASSEVCSTHGTCALAPVAATEHLPRWEAVAHAFSLPPPPLLNCSCDIGFAGPTCDDDFCTLATCIHGTCQNLTAGEPEDGTICVCDSNLWTGISCDIAVCAPGCSPEHGSCTDAPGGCTCSDGWAGSTCLLELTLVRRVGRFIEAHVALVFLPVTFAAMMAVAAAAMSVNVAAARSGAAAGNALATAAATAAASTAAKRPEEKAPLILGAGSSYGGIDSPRAARGSETALTSSDDIPVWAAPPMISRPTASRRSLGRDRAPAAVKRVRFAGDD